MLLSQTKQLFRSPIRLIAFLLLLSLSGALLDIGVNVLVDVNAQVAALGAQYTTIAIPDYRVKGWSPLGTSSEYHDIEFNRSRTVYQAMETAASLPQVSRIERRNMFSAHIPGAVPLISGSLDWRSYEELFDQPLNIAILIIACTSMEIYPAAYEFPEYDKNDPEAGYVMQEQNVLSYNMEATVEDLVLLHPDYPIPEEIVVLCNVTDADGNIPFEIGKTYIVCGSYTGVSMYQRNAEEWAFQDNPPSIFLEAFLVYDGAEEDLIVIQEKEGAFYRYYVMHEESPCIAELPTDMTADAFLQSDAGRVWRENILPACETTLQSVPVMTTDRLQGILHFNNHTTWITEGREFSEEEYSRGAKVCVLNAAFADKNGYKVGDTVPLSFFNSGATALQYFFGYGSERATVEIYNKVFPYKPGMAQANVEEFTIIGTYSNVPFAYGEYAFSPNTIFIPSRSAEPAPPPFGLNPLAMALMQSIILKNGSAEAFEAKMESMGFGGCFLYFDQGYSQADIGIAAMKTNANRLMLFGGVLFAVAVLLFAFLYALWAQRSAIILRCIGARPGIVFGNAALGMLGIALISTLLSGLLGMLLFDTICLFIFQDAAGSFAFSYRAAFLAHGAQFGCILLAGLGFIFGLLFRNPMRSLVK